MSTKPCASRNLRADIAARWRSRRFFCICGRRRSMTRFVSRTVSDRFSSSSWNGGVCEAFRISMSCASTSISPVKSSGLTVPSGRGRTSPVTRDAEFVAQLFRRGERRGAVRVADDLHETLAIAQVDEDDAAMIAAAMDPARQRDGLGKEAAVDAAAVVGAFHVRLRKFGSLKYFDGQDSGRAGRMLRAADRGGAAILPVQFRVSATLGAAAGSAAGRGRRGRPTAARGDHDPHRDDVLERLVDRDIELAHARLRHHDEIAAGGIRRRRHIDADVFARKMTRHLARRRAGQERDRPAARARKLDEQRLAEGGALIREDGVADLLDGRVDRLDERNAASSDSHIAISRAPAKLAATAPVASRIRNEQQHAEPGNVEPEQPVRVESFPGAGAAIWSSIDTSASSTQIVMPRGTQTSRPAMM